MLRNFRQKMNKKVCLCFCGFVLLAAAAVFLPRYFSRSLDARLVGKVHLAARNDFSIVKASSGGIWETIRAFCMIHDSASELTLLGSFDSAGQMDEETFAHIYGQVDQAVATGLLPWIGDEALTYAVSADGSTDTKAQVSVQKEDMEESLFAGGWRDYFVSAEYYCLTYMADGQEKTGGDATEMMNFIVLRYSDGENFDYYFIVDAVNYRVYYAEIYNTFTDSLAKPYSTIGMYDAEITDAGMEIVQSEQYGMLYGSLKSLDFMILEGCQEYYGPESADLVRKADEPEEDFGDKIADFTLSYEDGTAHVEERLLDEKELDMKGFSIGLADLESIF